MKERGNKMYNEKTMSAKMLENFDYEGTKNNVRQYFEVFALAWE